MATINCLRSSGRVTLTGTTIDIVNVADRGAFTVCNWSGAADLTVTVDSGSTLYAGVAPPDPVVGAAETLAIPSGTARLVQPTTLSGGVMIVKVLGEGNTYSIDRS